MKLTSIFQVLEHLNDFHTVSYGGHIISQNEAKLSHRHDFIAIDIPCKFGEDVFINK